MKAVVFAGGHATRISQLIGKSNKHLVPLGDDVLIGRGIRELAKAGATEFLILTNRGWEDTFAFLLRKDPSIDLSSVVIKPSQSPDLQLAEVLYEAKDFVGQEEFLLLLGDNLFLDSPVDLVKTLIAAKGQNIIVLAQSDDLTDFGVPIFAGGKLIEIQEKPATRPSGSSDLVVTGLARYTKQIFEVITLLVDKAESVRDLTAAHNLLLQEQRLGSTIWRREWLDIGTPEAYVKSLKTLRKAAGNVSSVPDKEKVEEMLREQEGARRIVALYKEIYGGTR